MPELTLDISSLSDFELPAWVLSILTLPQPADATRREKRAAALCAYVLLQLAKSPDTAGNPYLISPKIASMDGSAIDRELKSFHMDLTRSLEAARVASPFVFATLHNVSMLTPGTTRELSIAWMLSTRSDAVRITDEGNAKNRIWREYRPAVHLGLAMSCAIKAYEHQFLRLMSDIEFLQNKILAAWVLHQAILQERVIDRTPRLEHASNELLRIRLTEGGVTNKIAA